MPSDGKEKVFRVYAICPRENDKPFWLNIGLAFPHRDGKGMNLQLQALPLQDKLVIREVDLNEQPDAQAQETSPPAARAKKTADATK